MTYLPPPALPFEETFLDNANFGLVVGDLVQDGFIQVQLTVSTLSAQSSYVVTFGASATGIGGGQDAPDLVEAPSDTPLATVEVNTAVSGSDVLVTFTGTGPGDLVTLRGTTKRISRV